MEKVWEGGWAGRPQLLVYCSPFTDSCLHHYHSVRDLSRAVEKADNTFPSLKKTQHALKLKNK